MSLSGKTCLITGANSGLGFATAKRFAKLGAQVILVCRDRKKGENAMIEVEKETPGASVELMRCDLASMNSIRKFVRTFKETHVKLDVLFNNAAVMKQHRTVTEDGLEMMFQVNYAAPALLTTSLLDVLKSSSAARIINIAVPSHKLRLDFEDLQSSKHYSAYRAFFHSKLCLHLFTLELSRRLTGTGITVNSTDPGPGLFKSNLVREAPWPIGWIKNVFSATVDKAVETIVFLASSDELQTTTGKVFKERKTRATSYTILE